LHPSGGVPAEGPGPAPPPVSASVEVTLHGATEGARAEFAKAVQDYGDRLASEAQAQEISNRPDGCMYPEVTATSVFRAKDALNRFGPSEAFRERCGCFGGSPGLLWRYRCHWELLE
jgi:hypothetical protein